MEGRGQFFWSRLISRWICPPKRTNSWANRSVYFTIVLINHVLSSLIGICFYILITACSYYIFIIFKPKPFAWVAQQGNKTKKKKYPFSQPFLGYQNITIIYLLIHRNLWAKICVYLQTKYKNSNLWSNTKNDWGN